ncbi:MAG: TolC family protein [Leptospiraceae bacterium]|nr:TolC family protein [Leptospiraceae bacterium]MCK6379912.1 TolC family protein [Leptospiraceae bacterium]NUM40142.1 TolC family protein [Leptospiraceae bacterium]
MRYEKVRQAEAKKGLAFSMFLPTLSYRNQRTEFYPNPSDKQESERNKQMAYSVAGVPPAYLPLLNSSGSSSGTSLPPTLRSGQRLVLHVPIFTGLTEYSSYISAKSEIKVRKLEMSQEAMLLLTDLSQTYYTILLLEKSLQHKKEIQKLTKELIFEYRRRVNLGQARNSELSSIQARLATYDAEVFSIQEQIVAGNEKISYLCNVVSANPKLSDNILIQEPNFTLNEAIEKLEDRVDVRTAKASLGLAHEKVLAAKGGLLPNVYVDAQYSIPQGNTKSSIFAQFVFELPLFSGGKTIFAISEANSIKKEAEIFLKNTIRSGVEEIRRTYSAYRTGVSEVEAYKKALDSAERSHRLIRRDFQNKITNSLELLNSLTSLAQARESYDRAYLQNKLNRVLLGIVTGELPYKANNWKTDENKKDEKNK